MSSKVDLTKILNKHEEMYSKVVEILHLKPIEPKPKQRLTVAHYVTAGVIAIYSAFMPMVYAKEWHHNQFKIKTNEPTK